MVRQFASDFELKDDCTYVHGSTLLEWCWRLAAEAAGTGDWFAPRIDATFVRMIHANGDFWLAASADALPARQRLSAHFQLYDRHWSFWLGFEEKPDRPVTRRVSTRRRIEDIRLDAPFCGSCRIDASTLPVFVENVLEGCKRLHLLTVTDHSCPAVINAYMRGFPLVPTRRAALAELFVTNLSRRLAGASLATLSRLSCPEVDPQPFEIAYVLKFDSPQ